MPRPSHFSFILSPEQYLVSSAHHKGLHYYYYYYYILFMKTFIAYIFPRTKIRSVVGQGAHSDIVT
jgi:hypothetical protein